MSGLLDLVNPLQGTDSARDFSRGNTLPLVCTPWPMTAWTMQTGGGRWAYRWADAKIQGIRGTHQPSPWMGDHGHFTLMPQTGERLLGEDERAASYRREDLVVRPDYLGVTLTRYGCRVEVTPTERCCKMRFHFGAARHARLIVDCFDDRGTFKSSPDGNLLFGTSSANDGGVPDNFRLTFCLRLSVVVKAVHCADAPEGEGGAFLSAIEFEVPAGGVVECDVATSYLGEAQAARNLEREIGRFAFEEIRAATAARWEENLARIEVSDESVLARQTFYSCFYRTLTFPQIMHEEDGEGQVVHYSPYSGSRKAGVLYAGHGFWDAYRTTYPFYALVFPEKCADFLRGWMNACSEGGWYPRWPSPGYRVCMLSTQADVVFADAMVKNVGGFNLAEAYEGLRRNAFESVEVDAGYGRPGLREYVSLGYLPGDRYAQSVSGTLDNAHCDYCLSQIARKLGKTDDARELLRRSRFFANVFDPKTGFMRPKNSDGSWVEPFHEFQWGGAYVEGGPWQHAWGVPHDPAGLIHLHGGKEIFLYRLARMLTTPPDFTTGTYRSEIHEMTEMASASFGQYAHSNQPVHHALFLFDEAGAPDLTDHWVHRILNECYSSGPGGFSGDEDNGEMSAWYMMAAMGIFPLCPGKPGYKLVKPLFENIAINLPGGTPLEIRPGLMPVESDDSCFVKDGQIVAGRDISHAKVAEGGELEIPPVFAADPRGVSAEPVPA